MDWANNLVNVEFVYGNLIFSKPKSMLLLHKIRFGLSILTRETFIALRQDFLKQPDPIKLKQYMVPENVHQLAPLVATTQLQLNQKEELLKKLDELSSLDNDGGIRTTSYIKQNLSLCYMRKRQLGKARDYADEALQVIRLLKSQPQPAELANLYLHMSQVIFATKPSKEGEDMLKTAVSLFEKQHKLQPQNEANSLQLIFCYARLAYAAVLKQDFLTVDKWYEQGINLWNKHRFSDVIAKNAESIYPKSYIFLVQVKCIALIRSQTKKEKLIEQCKTMIQNNHVDPISKYWFIIVAEEYGVKDYDAKRKMIETTYMGSLGEQKLQKYVTSLRKAIGFK